MDGVKIQNQMTGTRSGFQLTPWAYVLIGVVGLFVGMVVGAGSEAAEAGFVIMLVSAVPFAIGVIAQGVKVGLRD